MGMREIAKRRNYSPDFKVKVVLGVLANEKTTAEISVKFGIHQSLVNKWEAQFKEQALSIFDA